MQSTDPITFVKGTVREKKRSRRIQPTCENMTKVVCAVADVFMHVAREGSWVALFTREFVSR